MLVFALKLFKPFTYMNKSNLRVAHLLYEAVQKNFVKFLKFYKSNFSSKLQLPKGVQC